MMLYYELCLLTSSSSVCNYQVDQALEGRGLKIVDSAFVFLVMLCVEDVERNGPQG